MDPERIEALAAFVRRYCAWSANAGDQTGGYFGFYAGRSARVARVMRRPIEVTSRDTFESIFPQVLQRARDVATSGEGNLYLRFYVHGASHPEEQFVVNGFEQDEDPAAGLDDGTVIGSLVSTIVLRSRMDQARIQDLERRIDVYHQGQLVGNEQLTLLAVAHNLLQVSAKQDQWRETLQAFAPVAASVLPAILAAMGAGMGVDPATVGEAARAAAAGESSAPAPDLTPSEEATRLVSLIVAAVQQLVGVVQKHPDAATADTLEPLKQIIVAIAPLFGLRVVPIKPPRA